jgi:hypothetical protein
MGWTKEEFIKFCGKAGVNPANAMREGKVDMRSPVVKAQDREARVKGAIKANKSKRKREAKERKETIDAIGNLTGRTENSIRESDPAMALEQTLRQQDGSLEGALPRYRVKITGMRVRPIDEDNFLAGCKAIIDGLVASGIIPRDDWKTTKIEGEQHRVKDWADEGTLIEIDLPEVSLEPLVPKA